MSDLSEQIYRETLRLYTLSFSKIGVIDHQKMKVKAGSFLYSIIDEEMSCVESGVLIRGLHDY